jgi:hypothetical protein
VKNIDLGAIKVPLDEYASQGNAILGIRDSGKSYTATAIAERLMDSGIPIIAFDPIGIWRYLRVPGAGKGYEVVVAGGKQGDLPLTARGAQEIVRAAMRENVSLVVDLYDIHLSKADWRTVVGTSIRTLLYENGEHGLRHIFIEEAAEFCPQNIGDQQGQVYAEVEKLARMGGNALLGYTLINQRAEQVNKAVLELCDCLILHRQKGRNSINALTKWLDIAAANRGNDIARSLPGLAQGECWVWPAGSDAPVRTKVPAKHSFHPDRRARQAPTKGEQRQVDVSSFVGTMRTTLDALVKEAEANDPKLLRAENARLRAELAKKPQPAAPASTKASGPRREDLATIAELRKALENAMKFIIEINAKDFFNAAGDQVDRAQIEKAIANAADAVKRMVEDHLGARKAEFSKLKSRSERVIADLQALLKQDVTIKVDVRHNESFTVTPAARKHVGNGQLRDDVTKPQQRILDSLAALEGVGINQPSKEQLALWCDVSPTSGGYFNNLGGLRSAGLIEYPTGGVVALTDAGRKAAQPSAPLTVEEMQESLCRKVGASKAAIVKALIELYPEPIAKDDLAERIGVSPTSGGYFNNLGSLRTLGVIDYPAPGKVAALPVLFLER